MGSLEDSVAALSVAPKAALDYPSYFADVKPLDEDSHFATHIKFVEDPSPQKMNLAVGAYRTDEGKPLVLNVVRKAEELLLADRSRNKEYLFMTGLPQFTKLSAILALGEDSPAIAQKRVVCAQALSATGSLRLGAEIISKHYGGKKVVYFPSPTWMNHYAIFALPGIEIRTYRYYDPNTHGLDYEGMLEDLRAAPDGAVVLLHGCAHNPTGVDPTREQWEGIRQVIRQEKKLLPFFDNPYQGFASGSLETDAWGVRQFANDGGEVFIAQSYAKNMGLYGERVGALILVTKDAAVATCLEGQLLLLIRSTYLSPPTHGASIVVTILSNKALCEEWKVELKSMVDRIISMRQLLFDALKARGTPGDWTYLLRDVGMFSLTGLNEEQVVYLREKHHVYLPPNGRISFAGLSAGSVPSLADAMHDVVNHS